MLRVPATRSDEDVAIELLAKQGFYLHPGHFYDFPSEGYLVASLITQGEDFARGMAHRQRAGTTMPSIRVSLGLHNLVEDAEVTYSLWNKLVLKRRF
jgi:hypothetical protein